MTPQVEWRERLDRFVFERFLLNAVPVSHCHWLQADEPGQQPLRQRAELRS